DHAAAPPNLGDIAEVEIKLIMRGLTEGGGLGICRAILLADICVFQNIKTFGVGAPQTIFNSVVYHFHKMSGTGGTTIEVTFFGGAGALLAARRGRGGGTSRSQCPKDGIQALDDGFGAANHQAIAAFQSPHPAAGARVHIMETPGGEFVGAPNVVNVIGVATVNDGVVFGEARRQISQSTVYDGGGNHQPRGAGGLSLATKS